MQSAGCTAGMASTGPSNYRLAMTNGIPWQALTDKALATLEVLGPWISNGYSYDVTARLVGKSEQWVFSRWRELREEIEATLAE
jgi:hypothetical protein